MRIHLHLLPRRVQKVLQGEYQVVISSPEALLDTHKLRNVIQAAELKDYRQFVVVDEAHVIQTWSKEFRVSKGLRPPWKPSIYAVQRPVLSGNHNCDCGDKSGNVRKKWDCYLGLDLYLVKFSEIS